jgi:hypothetical protein
MATVAAGDDRRREMMMLPAKMLSGWLFGVTVSKTRPELHDLLTAYQAECFDVLDAYWRQGVAVNPRVQVLPDDQPWIADQRSTPGQRFAEERARWERDEGRSMVDILGFTKPKLRSLEEFEGPLTKGDMLHKLTLLGFDIRYILGGERTLTDAERAIRDAYRLGDGADRKAIRQHAEAVRIVRTEARQALSSDSIDAIYAGADTVRYLRK